jgi:hypothetical protein
MRLSIKMKLAGAFGLVVVLTASVGAIGYFKLAAMNETIDRISTKRVPGLQLALSAQVHVLEGY